jgi:putative ABC transport system permease protein
MWLEHLRIAARALRGRPLRSLLTVISITLGALAIVLSTSLAESGLATLMRSIEELGGARLLLVAPKPAERAEKKAISGRPGLDSTDRERATTDVPHLSAHALMATLGKRDALSDQGRSARTDLVAGDAGFFEVMRMRVATGRALGPDDEARAARVCVVGPELAEKLWSGAALDRRLTVGRIRCRVVGVLSDNRRWGTNFGFDWNHLVVVPHETALALEPDVRMETSLALSTASPSHNDVVKRVINARLVEHRGGLDDFTIYDLGRVVERFESAFTLMKLLVGFCAAIALGIGGVGVMNMMLVSVSERVREIGIRKALGAAPKDLSRQFLVEASLLSTLGGGLGVGLGGGAALALGVAIRSAIPSWLSTLSMPAAATALVLSVAIGVGFGWLPARRAARLDPVEAIRR